jgi:putative membrane protein
MGKFARGAFVAAAILVSGTAFGQTSAPSPAESASAPGQLTDTDRAFVNEAAIDGMFVIAAGHIAEKASNSQVHSFASRTVMDRGAASNALKTIADAKGISLPDALDDKHQQLLAKLGTLEGAAFDREYAQEMLDAHDEDSRAYAEAGRTLNDAELREFARNTLSVIQGDAAMAHDFAGKVAEN